MQVQKPILLKLLLLGDPCVGKTSVFNRYIKEEYFEVYKATIGADFFTQPIETFSRKVVLQIWDTAGQERFHSLGPSFFRGSDACILVYDITDQHSFEALKKWVDKFTKEVGALDKNIRDSDLIFVVLGNKCDLEESRQVSTNIARSYCEENGFKFFEASAKNDIHINDAFEYVAERCIKMVEQQSVEEPAQVINMEDDDNLINLEDDDDIEELDAGCAC